jgi:hypothetical protein
VRRTRPPLCSVVFQAAEAQRGSPSWNLGAAKCSMLASNTTSVVEPWVAIEDPMPSKLRLESSIVFVPLFLGSLKKSPRPRGEEPYKAASEVWALISSSNKEGLAVEPTQHRTPHHSQPLVCLTRIIHEAEFR